MLEDTQQDKDGEGIPSEPIRSLNSPPTWLEQPPVSPPSALSAPAPPLFNILIVGQVGIGKTGLIKLLIDTSLLSSSISHPTLARLAEFANNASTCPTTASASVTLDLPATSQCPEIRLNLIDTPGLLVHDPQELERGIDSILQHITDAFHSSQLASAQERTDRHMHLCLYLLDPSDIVPRSTRHLRRPDRYGVPTKVARQRVHLAVMRGTTSASATVESGDSVVPGQSASATLSEPVNTQHYDDDPEGDWGRATVPGSEMTAIGRLAEFIAVLPVLAKADTLTNERLEVVKKAVRRDFAEYGLSLAPFERAQTQSDVAATENISKLMTNVTPPYAIMTPDSYHHGDGVIRTRTSARPTYQQYMSHYQEAQVRASEPLTRRHRSFPSGLFVRSYRWGAVDVLDVNNTDILALRETIMESNVMAIRDTSFKYYERYIKSASSRPVQEPSPAVPPPAPSIVQRREGSRIPGFSIPDMPSPTYTSVFPAVPRLPALQSQNVPSSGPQQNLPPIESLTSSSHQRSLSTQQPSSFFTPGALINPTLKYSHSAPALKSPPGDPSQQSSQASASQPPKHRTGRKIALACNFCRSRKLKCDGGRPQCAQCTRRNVTCEYEPVAKRRGLGKSSVAKASTSGDASGPAGSSAPTGQPISPEDDQPIQQTRSFACQFCRARKTRCDGLQPRCSACEKRNQQCIYAYNPISPETEITLLGGPRERPGSQPGSTTLPPIQSLALGSMPSEGYAPESSYWPSLQPSGSSSLPPRQSVPFPHGRTRTQPDFGSRHGDVDPLSRSQVLFAPPAPSFPGILTSDVRRPSTSETGGQSWLDRSSFSSSSTRGGGPGTPGSPILKRKVSDLREGERFAGEDVEEERSPSPYKRRRISMEERQEFYPTLEPTERSSGQGASPTSEKPERQPFRSPSEKESEPGS